MIERPDLDGFRLVHPGEPDLWLVYHGRRHRVSNSRVYERLFGDSAEPILEFDVTQVAEGAPLAEGACLVHPEDSISLHLLAHDDDGLIKLYPVSNWESWCEFGFDQTKIVELPKLLSEALPAGRPVSSRNHRPAGSETRPVNVQALLERLEAGLTASLRALSFQSEALKLMMARSQSGAHDPKLASLPLPAARAASSASLAERYGSFWEDAQTRPAHGRDVIWLGVIDWNFRIQRPQHLATNLALAGCRLFYVSIVFAEADARGRFEIVGSPALGVFEIRLKLNGQLPPNIYAGFTEEQNVAITAALDELAEMLRVQEPVVVVEYPSWYPVAVAIPGATVLHDCLDYVGGFDNVPPEMIRLEQQLVANADLVVTASKQLSDHFSETRETHVIRNAADIAFFARAVERTVIDLPRRPVIGYFGAIAYWFEVDWVAEAASAHPEWDFVLIGDASGADTSALRDLTNVRLLGEKPYSELPDHLASFDVAVIPFKLVELILCTNPVKLYEYMAGGKPVVASAMPEVVQATELVYIAEDAVAFQRQITRALEEDNQALQRRRMEWAQEHTWKSRAASFQNILSEAQPKVSIVVLSYNNWAMTRTTIWSVLALSDYSNLEIIVVDNASLDESPQRLKELQSRDARIRLILNGDNLGFAGGNNVGLRAATGDFIILLNNDTYVTRGWVRDLIRPLQLDQQMGLASPITNSIGNEQKVDINYQTMQEMLCSARSVVRRHKRERFDTDAVAFFCVAMRRDVLDTVGELDEIYGQGFYEDDDYCKRVLAAGYKICIVDDCFIHHHLSASFDKLGAARKRALMKRNKAIFESRWGEWKPHTYRDAPGFG